MGVAVPLAILLGTICLYSFGMEASRLIKLPCVFYELTNLNCPGCGAGRASRAILHLDFIGAFSFNPLYVMLLPFGVYAFCVEYLRFVFHFYKYSAVEAKSIKIRSIDNSYIHCSVLAV